MHLAQKLAANGSKVVAVETINHYFDSLYVPAVFWLGPWIGGVVMTVLAIALNYIFVRVYNGLPGDWYGFEWMRSKLKASWWWLVIAVPYFLFWCWWDPFAGFIFARGKKNTQYRFQLLDWMLLVGITIFGSIIWTGLVWGGIEFVKRVASW